TNAGARAGDRIVLTKPLGTGILSTALKREKLPPSLARRVTRSMATLNRVAAEVAVEFGARAATDVTGFGLLGHASQMADASGVTFRLAPDPRWLMPRVADFAREGVKPGGLQRNRDFYGAALGCAQRSLAPAQGLERDAGRRGSARFVRDRIGKALKTLGWSGGSGG